MKIKVTETDSKEDKETMDIRHLWELSDTANLTCCYRSMDSFYDIFNQIYDAFKQVGCVRERIDRNRERNDQDLILFRGVIQGIRLYRQKLYCFDDILFHFTSLLTMAIKFNKNVKMVTSIILYIRDVFGSCEKGKQKLTKLYKKIFKNQVPVPNPITKDEAIIYLYNHFKQTKLTICLNYFEDHLL